MTPWFLCSLSVRSSVPRPASSLSMLLRHAIGRGQMIGGQGSSFVNFSITNIRLSAISIRFSIFRFRAPLRSWVDPFPACHCGLFGRPGWPRSELGFLSRHDQQVHRWAPARRFHAYSAADVQRIWFLGDDQEVEVACWPSCRPVLRIRTGALLPGSLPRLSWRGSSPVFPDPGCRRPVCPTMPDRRSRTGCRDVLRPLFGVRSATCCFSTVVPAGSAQHRTLLFTPAQPSFAASIAGLFGRFRLPAVHPLGAHQAVPAWGNLLSVGSVARVLLLARR